MHKHHRCGFYPLTNPHTRDVLTLSDPAVIREKKQQQKLLHGCGLTSSDTRMIWSSDPSFGCFSATVLRKPSHRALINTSGKLTLPSSEKVNLQVWNNVWSHFSFCIPGEIFSFFENIKKSHYLTSMNTLTFSTMCHLWSIASVP